MRMRRCQRIGAGLVHPGMDHKRCPVNRTSPFDHIALVIDQDKVGGFDSVERHPEWIHPEILGVFVLSYRDVTCYTFGEAEPAEESEPGGQLLLAVLALRLDRAEDRRLR